MRRSTAARATVIGAAVVLVTLAAIWAGVGRPTPASAPGSRFGPAPLAFTGVHEAHSGPDYYYNTTIIEVDPPATWSDLGFHVQNDQGATVLAGSPTVEVTNGAATCLVAVFSFANSSWSIPPAACADGTLGGSAPAVSGAAVELRSAANFTAAGDDLVVVGSSSSWGSCSLSIP